MNGLAGWVGPETPPDVASERLSRMIAPVRHGARGPAAVVVGARAGLAASRLSGPASVVRDHGFVAALVGRPRLTDTALRDRERDDGLARVVLDAYRTSGAAIVERIGGAFALVIVAENGERGLLATDRIGGRCPIAYRPIPGGLLFGTRTDCIRRHPDGESEIDPQAIYDYLYFNVVPGPGSAWSGLRYLPAAHLLEFRDGRTDVRPYWKPIYRDVPEADLEAMSEQFRTCLRQVVSRSCDVDQVVGSFLSGGIDSSTLAGLVREATGSPARTFSIGFDADGFDEMSYARIAVEHFGTRQHEYYVRPEDVIEILPELVGAYSEPFGNASAIPVHCCARLAREHGIERMLGGDGGDELFAGNTRYATQKVFGAYDSVPSWLRGGVLEPVADRATALDWFLPARKVRRYIEQARVPMPDRLETYNQLERYGASRILKADFLASVDPSHPKELLGATYHGADATDMLGRMLALDMKFTLADNDLPKVTVMTELAGVDVDYPFLDDDMVSFSLGVPSRWKLRHLRLRWFVKQALSGFLPAAILVKEKHGFGLPFGLWMRDHAALREFTLDHLESMKARAIIRPAFIDELVHRHATEHATYYGVMIWVLLVLELWFRDKTGAAP